MRHVSILRDPSSSKQTLGHLQAYEPNDFECHTLELPWLDNQSNVSCIPDGDYICKYTPSMRLSKVAGHEVRTYEVLNVPNRAGIRIHSANFFRQLLGCIALGEKVEDVDIDGEGDVTESRKTVAAFEKAMGYQDFLLHIYSDRPRT